MTILWLILIGIGGGIIGGMGMGGGTLLIPLLTILMNTEQNVAQSVNLIAFIPMSIIAIIIHKKNNLIEKKGLLRIILPALVTSILSAILVGRVQNRVLSVIYGSFILFIGVFSIIITTVNLIKEKKSKTEKE